MYYKFFTPKRKGENLEVLVFTWCYRSGPAHLEIKSGFVWRSTEAQGIYIYSRVLRLTPPALKLRWCEWRTANGQPAKHQ